MEIIVGKTAGFCFGVKRAVEGCQNQIKDNKKVYCLGEIVHNKRVVTDLQEKGIIFIEDINEAPNSSTVIVRAHGVPKKVYEIATQKNINLVDYSCPKVLNIHKIVEKYHNNGYYIILIGEKNHPEIIGTKSYAENNISIIEELTEIEKVLDEIKNSNNEKGLIISQTTFNTQKFETIKNELENIILNNIELIVKNTICEATEIRQKEAEKMSQDVDMMIIIGGKNSSNTTKLYEIAFKNCKDTILIETVNEIKTLDFNNINKLGIMAGASTPKNLIDEVVDFLKNENKTCLL